jgi:hypothetical protein
MASGIVVALPALLLLAVVPVLLVGLALTARPDAELAAATAAARRHAVTGGVLAVVAGACVGVAALAVVPTTGGARLLTLAPPAAALAHTVVLAVTELTWPRPRGAVRRVVLAPRDVRSSSPAWLRRTLHVLVALTLVAVAAGALAAADDQRSLRLVAAAGDGSPMTTVSSPFPGWSYGGPALVGVLAVLVAAEAVLLLVVRRPAVAGADAVTDTVLRRASAHRVLRGAVAGVLATLGPLTAVAGTTAASASSSLALNGSPRPLLHGLGVALAALGVLACLGALVVACLPAPRVPAPDSSPGVPVPA